MLHPADLYNSRTWRRAGTEVPAELAPVGAGAYEPNAQGELSMEPVIRYYGWSALSIETAQGTLVFDPFYRKYCGAKWAALDDYARAEIICVTHGHEEHFADVPSVARKTGALVVGPAAVGRFLRGRNRIPAKQVVDIAPFETREFPGFKITSFNWKHRDINLWKALSKAVFFGRTAQLAWAVRGATLAPFYAPYTGYHVELPGGTTILNYNEGFNSKMTDAEIEDLGKRFRTDVLLGGYQLDFAPDLARGVAALKPKVAVLYPPHEKFHAMMGAVTRPVAEFVAAAQQASPGTKIVVVEPGAAVTTSGKVIPARRPAA